MKKFLAVLVIMTVVFSGCSYFGKKTGDTPKPNARQNEPEKNNQNEKKEYYIGLKTPVKGIDEWVKKYQPYEGVFEQKKDGYRLVMISQGEKFSEGYKVTIDKVSKGTDRWVVQTSIVKPQNEDYSGKTTVYPREVVSILDDNMPIEVVKGPGTNSEMSLKPFVIPEGKELTTSKNFIALVPPTGEKITSPVIIKGKARVFEANFRIIIEDGHYQLAKKIQMADQGAPGWGYFEVSLPFDKPTNPAGSIIFSYANMANGDMIEELILPVKF